MKKKFKKIRGFTIIELLVVISIISILMTLSLIGSDAVRKKARDARRKNDLSKVQGALLMYFTDKKYYPLPCGEPGPADTSNPCFYDGSKSGFDRMFNGNTVNSSAFTGLKGLGYSQGKIQDEKNNPSDGFAYRYRPSEDGLNFELSARLENSNDGDLKKDNPNANPGIKTDGSDKDRYEVGTDKGIRTDDCADSTNCVASAVYKIDLFPNDVVANIGKWTYEFPPATSKIGCLMQ